MKLLVDRLPWTTIRELGCSLFDVEHCQVMYIQIDVTYLCRNMLHSYVIYYYLYHLWKSLVLLWIFTLFWHIYTCIFTFVLTFCMAYNTIFQFLSHVFSMGVKDINVTDTIAKINFVLTIYYFKRSLLSVRYYCMWWGWGNETQPWRQGSSHRFIQSIELMRSADPLTRWFTLHLQDTGCNKCGPTYPLSPD